MQLHVRLERASLPSDPVSAFADVLGRAKNLEVRIAGSGLIADNLAARLDATRLDALYARVLFLFLGAPGVAIAVLLTLAVAAAGRGYGNVCMVGAVIVGLTALCSRGPRHVPALELE